MEAIIGKCLSDWYVEFAEQVVLVFVLEMPHEAMLVAGTFLARAHEQILALIDWLFLAVKCGLGLMLL